MSAPTSTEAGSEPLEYTYTTWDGKTRKAVVGVDAIEETGAWSVYDMPVGGKHTHGWLVDRIDAPDDKLDEATSLARAYAADQQGYHDGERGGHAKPDPLPRPVVDENGRHQPVEVPLAEIRKHVALARRQAAGKPDPQAIAA
jgi:hypothetical protein